MDQYPENRSQKEEDQIHTLGSLIASYLNFGNESSKRRASAKQPEHKDSPKKTTCLYLLQLIPWLLLLVFLFSFYWDLDSMQVVIFGRLFEIEGLLRIVSVSGLIGFLTNWIAITMLFKPLYKRPLLGQGLIPAHKNRIAFRLASAVSDDIINTQLINEKIDDSNAIEKLRIQTIRHIRKLSKKEDFRADLKAWILRYLESVMKDQQFKKKITDILIADIDKTLQGNAVERFALQAYTFVRGRSLNNIIEDMIDRLPASAEQNLNLVDDYLDKLPEKFENRSRQVEDAVKQIVFQLVNQLDVQQFAEENLSKYDEQRLEKMIKNATNEHLRVIQYLGAVLGTIGGLIIWEPVISLAALLTISGLVLLADNQIIRFKNKRNSIQKEALQNQKS